MKQYAHPPGRWPAYLELASSPGSEANLFCPIIHRTCFWYFSSGDTTKGVVVGGVVVGCDGLVAVGVVAGGGVGVGFLVVVGGFTSGEYWIAARRRW